MGVHYVWFHTYRVVGPKPNPELALTPEQVLRGPPLRRRRCGRGCRSRSSTPTGTTRARRSARWRPASATTSARTATSSRARSSSSRRETIRDDRERLRDDERSRRSCATSARRRPRRRAAASCSSGRTWCAIWSRKHGARDTTQRGTALAELEAMQPRHSQQIPARRSPRSTGRTASRRSTGSSASERIHRDRRWMSRHC